MHRLWAAALAGLIFFVVPVGPAGADGTLSDYKLLQLDGRTVKWGDAGPGVGATVTFAVVPTELQFEGARNCPAIGPVDALLSASRVARRAFDVALAEAFATWSSVANISFLEAPYEDADILIGAQTIPRGRGFTNVAYAPSPEAPGRGTIVRSVICLNPTTGWKIGFDGHLDVYDLRYTLAHEIGHAIGLDHPGKPGELMDFRYSEAFASLQAGDRAGAVRLYGPAPTLVANVNPKTPTVLESIEVAERNIASDLTNEIGPALGASPIPLAAATR